MTKVRTVITAVGCVCGSLMREGHKEASWGPGSVLDLDLSGGHTAYTLVKLL